MATKLWARPQPSQGDSAHLSTWSLILAHASFKINWSKHKQRMDFFSVSGEFTDGAVAESTLHNIRRVFSQQESLGCKAAEVRGQG